jgi:lysophospholipase L1-like esterase
MTSFSRRKFLNRLSLTGLASLSLPSILSASSTEFTRVDPAEPFTILFQGDSITDGNRGRSSDPNHIMGHGYAFSIASRLGADYPDRNLLFINKGISGNTVTDLSNRWKEDTLDLKPNVVSILVGVNDVYFRLKNNDTSVDNFESVYKSLLDQTLTQFPNVLFVLGEPFVLPVGMVKENLSRWTSEIEQRQTVVKKLAKDYNAVFVGYQEVFTKACKKADASYWIWDGIHPTVAGHELMAREWIASVGKTLSIITPEFSLKK